MTEKYLEISGLLFTFLQLRPCSKAYPRLICYFHTIYTYTSVSKLPEAAVWQILHHHRQELHAA